MTSTAQPRRIDPVATFAAISDWIADTVKKKRAPGLIVGLSGTDSILTFLACADALKKLNMQHRLLGLNFQHGTHDEVEATRGEIVCAKTDFNWVARDIFPWLKERAAEAQFEIDDTIPHSDDNMRWGHLFSRAVRDTDPRQGLTSRHFFPVGTRNATEQAVGNYSQISRNVSLQPIIQLYKTEVLQLCEYLGVPQIAIDKSREIDCDCGRFETQAHHMNEVDLYIMHKQGLLDREYIKQNIPQDVMNLVLEFYMEETSRNAFREKTPYKPEQSLVMTQ